MSARPRIAAIVGVTASGKTALAEAIAVTLGAEIVCADSRQVFRELEIGTGKPTEAERSTLPHHLFDALQLGARASAGWYAEAAAQACRSILARGRLPLLVGGSGLYLRALQCGLSAAPPEEPEIRARLQGELEALGPEAMHQRLAQVDPASAARIGPRDRQRIVRGLEVFEASGRPLSGWNEVPATPAIEAEWRVVEVTMSPRALDGRIVRRTRAMLEGGLVEETRGLVARGLEGPLRRLNAVGYDESLDLLAGRLTPAETEARINLRTRQLAKRQRTWFRHQIEATRFEGAEELGEELVESASSALSNS